MFQKVDHVAIAVRSLESALQVYTEELGFGDWSIEEIPDQKTRVALLPIGECRIELLEATAPDSPVAVFIARRGEVLHHICFQVENLAEELRKLKASGVRLIDSNPRFGAGGRLIAFIHPSSATGVLIELSQPGMSTTVHSPSE